MRTDTSKNCRYLARKFPSTSLYDYWENSAWATERPLNFVQTRYFKRPLFSITLSSASSAGHNDQAKRPGRDDRGVQGRTRLSDKETRSRATHGGEDLLWGGQHRQPARLPSKPAAALALLTGKQGTHLVACIHQESGRGSPHLLNAAGLGRRPG